MTLSRTKIMVGVLVLSVGGLAVWADDRNDQLHTTTLPVESKNAPSPVVRTNDVTAPDPCEKHASRPSPVVSESSGVKARCPLEVANEIMNTSAIALEPLDLPAIPMPTAAPSIPAPPSSPIPTVQTLEIPLQQIPPAPPLMIPAAPPVPQLVLEPMAPPSVPTPPMPSELVPYTPAPVVQTTPPAPVPMPQTLVPPMTLEQRNYATQATQVPQAPQVPQAQPMVTRAIEARATSSSPAPLPVAANNLRLLLRMGNTEASRFEIKLGEELLLKVYADKMEMQAPSEGAQPLAGITATGNVRFYGPGVSGVCDQLAIVSSTGEVMMKGRITMKCKKGRLYNEVTAEKMMFQLGGSGLNTLTGNRPTPRTNTEEPITPTTYNPTPSTYNPVAPTTYTPVAR